MRRWLPLLIASSFLLLAFAAAAIAAPPGTAAAVTDTTASGAAALADSLANGVAPADSATPRDYLAEARAAFTPVNRAYSDTRVLVRIIGPLYGILAGLLLMFSGLSVRFRDIAHGLGHRRYVRVLVYFALYSATIFLLSLPLAWFEEYALEHQYGLSNQTLGGWLMDSLKGLVFSIFAVGVVPLLALAWGRIEAQPKRWWIWIAAGTLPVTLVAVVLQPIVFDPLFNKFTPLHDTELRAQILTLAAKAGIPGRHVYEVDMSSKTKKINAYVSGFGASQRIVLWDTTLKAMKRDEILFVMGHEMGHYVLNHIWKYLAVLSLGAFAAFWLCARFAEGWLALFGARWGVTRVSDLAAMPVLLLSLTMVTLVALPALNWLSCAVEHESDIYALELTHDNDAGARAFLELARGNRSNPEPPEWVRILLFDHPPLADRIRFALEYKPWEKGDPNRFYHPKPVNLASR